MFIGIQKNNIVYACENREEIENLPNIVISTIDEVNEPVELIDGMYYIGENNIIEAKKISIRSFRNDYLERYIDPIVSNPLRWSDLSSDEQNKYINYRLYLLNYTNQENWWEEKPKKFENWIND